MKINGESYLTVPEAAERVGVTNQTIYNWLLRDRIKTIRIGVKILMVEQDVYRMANEVRPRRARNGVKQAA